MENSEEKLNQENLEEGAQESAAEETSVGESEASVSESIESTEPTEEPKKKRRLKKSTIVSISVGVLAVGVGVGVTFALFGGLMQDKVVFAGDFNALEDDQEALMAEYEASNGNVDSFRPYEILNIALNNFDASENHYSQVKGNVLAMGVNQAIYGTSIRSGDTYFNESLSASSMVQAGKRFLQQGDSVATYNGKVESSSPWKAAWESEPTTDTLESYEEKWGRNLTRGNIYIISEQTVLEDSKEIDESGNYRITVSLDPIKSVSRYKVQMVSMSGLSEKPTFDSVTLEYVIDKDLNLVSSTFTESYDVVMVVSAHSEGVLNTYYFQDQSLEIPDLTKDIDYSIFDE